MHKQTKLEKERMNRIRLSIYAYAYEVENDSLVSDEEFDRLSRSIDPNVSTNHKVMDSFFRKKFHPDTGMWIHEHPEINRIKELYEKHHQL